jgi:hypothetical protein
MITITLKFLTKIFINLPQSLATTITKEKIIELFRRKKERTLKSYNRILVSKSSEVTESSLDFELTIPLLLKYKHTSKRKSTNRQAGDNKDTSNDPIDSKVNSRKTKNIKAS